MLARLENYYNKKIKESEEFEIRTAERIRRLKLFRELIESHSHYKQIDKRVTKKWNENGSAWIGDFYGSGYAIRMFYHHENCSDEIREIIRDSDGNNALPTPQNIITSIDIAVDQYERALNSKTDFPKLKTFLEEISNVAEKHGSDYEYQLERAYWRS